MSVKLSRPQATALSRIATFSRGRVRTYTPAGQEERTFRILADKGYCQYRCQTEPGVEHSGYELTDKGRDFLNGRRA